MEHQYLHGAVLDGQSDTRLYFTTGPDTADGQGAIREGAAKTTRPSRTGGFFITPSDAVRGRVLEIDFRGIVHGCRSRFGVPVTRIRQEGGSGQEGLAERVKSVLQRVQ